MMMNRFILIFSVSCLLACKSQSPDTGNVIGYASPSPTLSAFTDSDKPDLHAFLLTQTDSIFAARKQALAKDQANQRSMKARQQRLKAWYDPQITSSFPKEKCDLNARITGEIRMFEQGYRIEKILFQSRENHHVTANLYLPLDPKGKIPGVLMTCGHSNIGKAAEVYQAMCILLAKNGMACLIVDPIGQGERFQFLDEKGQPATRGGTLTHSLMDYAANLTGTDVVSFMAWDNIRGIDYLLSRPEVDPAKIGITGNSGGGTQTSFLMAYDERISVAVPSCYITAHEGLIGGIGPQDGCQQLYGEGTVGFDHGDFLNMVAPMPIRILSAEQDFFPIAYTRKTFAEVQKTYQVLGKPDQVSLFTHDDKHGFSGPRRQAGVQWFRKWFFEDDSPVQEPEWNALPDSVLWVCPTGQVLSYLENERSVVDILKQRSETLASERNVRNSAQVRKKIAELLTLPPGVPDAELTWGTAESHRGFTLTPVQIQAEEDFPIPGLWMVPNGYSGKGPVHLLVDGKGKAMAVQANGSAFKFLRMGQPVLAIDLRSFGESLDDSEKNTYIDGTQSDYRNAMISWFIGKPMLGQRVQEIRVAAAALRKWTESEEVFLHAYGRAAIAGLHAACFDSQIQQIELKNCPSSWKEFVEHPLQQEVLSQILPNALTHYDLEDLVSLIGPDKVVWKKGFVREEL